MRIWTLFFLAMLLCALRETALCQQAPPPAPPKIACDGALFDFGVQDESEPVKKVFVIRNDGAADLLIRGVRTSCGCAAASPSTNRIAAGEQATVSVTLSLRGRRGAQTKSVTVESNDPVQPAFMLTLTGTATSELSLEPPFVTFGNLEATASATREVRLASRSPDTRITNAVCDSPYFRAEIAKPQAGLPPTILLSTVPPLPGGQTRGTLRVYTDHPSKKELEATVMAIVLPEVRVLPDEIVVRGQPGTGSRHVALRVLPCSVREFQVLSVEMPLPSMQSTLKKTETGDYLIDIPSVPCGPEINGKNIRIRTTLHAMREIVVPLRFIQEATGG